MSDLKTGATTAFPEIWLGNESYILVDKAEYLMEETKDMYLIRRKETTNDKIV